MHTQPISSDCRPTQPHYISIQPSSTHPDITTSYTQPSSAHPRGHQPPCMPTQPLSTSLMIMDPLYTPTQPPSAHLRATQLQCMPTQAYTECMPPSTGLMVMQPPSIPTQPPCFHLTQTTKPPLNKLETIQTTLQPNQPSMLRLQTPYVVPVSTQASSAIGHALDLSKSTYNSHGFQDFPSMPTQTGKGVGAAPSVTTNNPRHFSIDISHHTPNTASDVTFHTTNPHSLPSHTSTNTLFHLADPNPLSLTPHSSTYSPNTPSMSTDPLSQMPDVKPTLSSFTPVSSSRVHQEVERLLIKATLLALEKDPNLGRSTRFGLGVMKALMAWGDQQPTPPYLSTSTLLHK